MLSSTNFMRSRRPVFRAIIIWAVTSTAIVGCATPDDPRKANPIEGAWGVVSGKYQDRNERRRKELKAEQSILAQRTKNLQALLSEQTEIETKKRALDNRLTAIHKRLADFDAELKKSTQLERGERNTLEQARSNLEKLRTREQALQSKTGTVDPVDEGQLTEMERRIAELEKLIQDSITSSVKDSR